MITTLFWNINGVAKGGRNPITATEPRYTRLADLLAQAVTGAALDILVLAESPFKGALPLSGMESATTNLLSNQKTGCTLDIFYRSATVRMDLLQSAGRATIQKLSVAGSGTSLLFVTAHLASPQRASEEKNREEAVRTLTGLILNAEKREGQRRTLIVGDLNYNPYDLPVYAGTHLRAVPT